MEPSGDGTATFRVAKDRLLGHFRATGNSAMFLEGLLIPDVLEHPAAVFEGLERPGQEESLCYAGVPSKRYVRDKSIEVPFPPGKTFLVFMTCNLKVTKWGWADEDPESPGYPMEHQTRFGRRLWPQE